jgi:hypothetical protein
MNVTLYTVNYLPVTPLNALHANSINSYSMYYIITYTVKKVNDFPVPSRTEPNSLWLRIIKIIFPAMESLVSVIPAGDGKTDKLFFNVYYLATLFLGTVEFVLHEPSMQFFA